MSMLLTILRPVVLRSVIVHLFSPKGVRVIKYKL